MPFFALSLAAGLIRTPLRAYLAGTALGILPATATISLLGQGLISGRAGVVATSALAAVALAVLIWLLTRRHKVPPRSWSAPAPAAPLARGPR